MYNSIGEDKTMKRKNAAILWISVIIAFVSIVFISCSNSSTGGSAVVSWSISGTIDYGGATVGDVKLAAFYVPYGATFPAGSEMVSNVVNLGTAQNPALPFTLNIDAAPLSPALGDNIMLLVWQDTGSTADAYDSGEDWYMTFPDTGCQVFENAVACLIYYYDIEEPSLGIGKGWNISISLAGFKLITNANNNFTGALVEDVYPWS
jgi:hypothetical protein